MIHTTRWTTDTCGCTIEYQWDDLEPEGSRTIIPIRIIEKCVAHVGINNPVILYTILTDENPRKNKLIAKIIERLPNRIKIILNPDGTQTIDLSNISWYFDSNRVLHVIIQGITQAERVQLQNAVDSFLGAGRVVVD